MGNRNDSAWVGTQGSRAHYNFCCLQVGCKEWTLGGTEEDAGKVQCFGAVSLQIYFRLEGQWSLELVSLLDGGFYGFSPETGRESNQSGSGLWLPAAHFKLLCILVMKKQETGMCPSKQLQIYCFRSSEHEAESESEVDDPYSGARN